MDWMEMISDERLIAVLRRTAQTTPYPATPDIAARVMRRLGTRRLSLSKPARGLRLAAVFIVLTAALLSVPAVRAAVIEFLEIGGIRIFSGEEIPMEAEPGNAPPPGDATPFIEPGPSGVPLNSVLDLAGQVSLAEAREQFPFPIMLPADLREPDEVFVQRLDGGQGVFMVWLAADDPARVELSLLLLAPGAFAGKGAPTRVTETTVNGEWAVWTEGEHLLVMRSGTGELELLRFFVEGNVLIWTIGEVTYRLEGTFTLAEAVALAESVR